MNESDKLLPEVIYLDKIPKAKEHIVIDGIEPAGKLLKSSLNLVYLTTCENARTLYRIHRGKE